MLLITCFVIVVTFLIVSVFFMIFSCFFVFFFFFFFFKQKTAYEIGTGDWSSDVCLPISSDPSAHSESARPYPARLAPESHYDQSQHSYLLLADTN